MNLWGDNRTSQGDRFVVELPEARHRGHHSLIEAVGEDVVQSVGENTGGVRL